MNLIVDTKSNDNYFILIDADTKKEFVKISKCNNTLSNIKIMYDKAIKEII